MPAEQTLTRPPHDGFGVAVGDVQERDLGVRGQPGAGLGNRGLPGVLDDPHERVHCSSDLQTQP